MSPKNLNVTKIPKILEEKLSNKRIIKLYNNFEKDFDIKNAKAKLSGPPDTAVIKDL